MGWVYSSIGQGRVAVGFACMSAERRRLMFCRGQTGGGEGVEGGVLCVFCVVLFRGTGGGRRDAQRYDGTRDAPRTQAFGGPVCTLRGFDAHFSASVSYSLRGRDCEQLGDAVVFGPADLVHA